MYWAITTFKLGSGFYHYKRVGGQMSLHCPIYVGECNILDSDGWDPQWILLNVVERLLTSFVYADLVCNNQLNMAMQRVNNSLKNIEKLTNSYITEARWMTFWELVFIENNNQLNHVNKIQTKQNNTQICLDVTTS